jgi:DNA-binding NarL/FixJ family response regulator
MIQIFLVDDHRALTDGMKVGLQQQPDFIVVGQATDGYSAIDAIERLPTPPDVVISDIDMKGMNGLKLLPEMKKRWPKTKVMMLTLHTIHIDEAFSLGASGYILKDSGIAEIVTGIRAIMDGKIYTDDYLVLQEKNKQGSTDQITEFTSRELSIIKLICDERTTREISEKLNISFTAVETYSRTIRRKTGAANIAGIVKYAIKNGIV